jgi:hypothetical protein
VRRLAALGGEGKSALLKQVLAGQRVVTIAYRDVAEMPVQWVAGGAVANTIIAHYARDVVLISIPENARRSEDNLAATPISELKLARANRTVLSSDAARV